MKNEHKEHQMRLSKELKLFFLKLLQKGYLTQVDKDALIEFLELPAVQVEIIDKREEVRG